MFADPDHTVILSFAIKTNLHLRKLTALQAQAFTINSISWSSKNKILKF